MLDAVDTRRPDRRFAFSDQRVALGGWIGTQLPEDRFDRQPLWTPSGSACLVADVRLDNRPELICTLQLTQADELADSAILLQAWVRWGEDCLVHLTGAFAFAVWTPSQQTLFAARDHAGERPLHYFAGDGLFALASMPGALLSLPQVSGEIDEERMRDQLALLAPDSGATFFKAIRKVPPGHLLRVRPDGVTCMRYWHPSGAKPVRYKRDEEYAEALAHLLDEATAARLRSTGEIASQLSAGLDSSAVTATAARLLAREGRRLTAFTAVPRKGFDGITRPNRIASEGAAAAEVAVMYANIDHVTLDSEGYDLLDDGKSWAKVLDEPPFNPTNWLWYTAMLDRARGRGVGVMLTGAAGNATFSFESKIPYRTFFRSGRWLRLAYTAYWLRRRGDGSIKETAWYALDGMLPRGVERWLNPSRASFNFDHTLIHPDLVEEYGLHEKAVRQMGATVSNLTAYRALLFDEFDFGCTNAAVLARTGIEQRDPTSDRRIFEFCYGIPEEQLLVGGHSRSLARRAMKGRLPETTRLRYERGVQSADWYLTMEDARPSLRRELARVGESPVVRRLLDLRRAEALLDHWPEGGYETPAVTSPWDLALSRGMAAASFVRDRDR